MEEWIREGLFKILDFEIPEDLIKYILSIENETDLNEYLKTLLDFDNSQHKNFYLELTKKVFPNRGSSQSKQLKKKISKNKQQQDFMSNEPPQSLNTEVEAKLKKKTKYVNLYSQEGKNAQTILLKGRHHCDCQASKHELINNCLQCGRVVCKQEGSGPCLFCGNLKKRRAKNWTPAEKGILRKMIAASTYIIENKSNATNINLAKAKEWKNIMIKFNQFTGSCRSTTELKLAWKRMKLLAKAKLCAQKQACTRSRGGQKPVSPADIAVQRIVAQDFIVGGKNDKSDPLELVVKDDVDTSPEINLEKPDERVLKTPCKNKENTEVKPNTSVRRGKNWTTEEKEVLRKITAASAYIIENKCTRTHVNRAKAKEWKNIMNKFNKITGSGRSTTEVKLAWKRIKIFDKAQKVVSSAHKEESARSGDGQESPSRLPSTADIDIQGIIAGDFVVEVIKDDSDALQFVINDDVRSPEIDLDKSEDSVLKSPAHTEDNTEVETNNSVAEELDSEIQKSDEHKKIENVPENVSQDLKESFLQANIEFKKRQLQMAEEEHNYNIKIAQLTIKKLELEINLLKNKQGVNNE